MYVLAMKAINEAVLTTKIISGHAAFVVESYDDKTTQLIPEPKPLHLLPNVAK